MASPPKPWERSSPATTQPSIPATATTSSSEPPVVPPRPAVMGTQPAPAASTPYSAQLAPYSPYSRLGTSYSPYGGGMYGGGLGYGGMNPYGGYGYGMNNMYGGMPGVGAGYPGIDPNNPSLTQTLEATTQHTFSLLHSIVQTFSGVAQMLESTFMATHSSFFAMVGVVEQFAHLRNALGSVLGLFGLVRWMKEFITGRPSTQNSLQGEFREFINGKPVQGPTGPPAPKPSKKPLIIFFLAVIGIPYAMSRLVKILNERVQQQQQQIGGPPLIDPSTLPFARALYSFAPSSPSELALRENEIVAVTSKLDPHSGMEVDPRSDVETDWWRGRTRDGREGWFPRKWVEVLERRKPVEQQKTVE